MFSFFTSVAFAGGSRNVGDAGRGVLCIEGATGDFAPAEVCVPSATGRFASSFLGEPVLTVESLFSSPFPACGFSSTVCVAVTVDCSGFLLMFPALEELFTGLLTSELPACTFSCATLSDASCAVSVAFSPQPYCAASSSCAFLFLP